jgi:hypothetical protein
VELATRKDTLEVSFGDVTLVWDLPGHLQRFVSNFDRGQYPALLSGHGNL